MCSSKARSDSFIRLSKRRSLFSTRASFLDRWAARQSESVKHHWQLPWRHVMPRLAFEGRISLFSPIPCRVWKSFRFFAEHREGNTRAQVRFRLHYYPPIFPKGDLAQAAPGRLAWPDARDFSCAGRSTRCRDAANVSAGDRCRRLCRQSPAPASAADDPRDGAGLRGSLRASSPRAGLPPGRQSEGGLPEEHPRRRPPPSTSSPCPAWFFRLPRPFFCRSETPVQK